MRKLLSLWIALVIGASASAWAQMSPIPGFPPGTFQNRAALDATPAGGATCASVLSGLVLNLDASNSASVIRTGANVTAWNDLSGNGNNFTATNSPQYSATGFNGSKPGVTVVAATPSFLANTSVPFNSANLSVFVVQTNTTNTQSNGGIVSFVGAGQANDFGNNASFVLATQDVLIYRMTSNGYDDSSLARATATPETIGWIFDGTNGTGYINFSAGTPAAKTGTLGATTANIAIGTRTWNGNTPSFDGTYGEIIITASALSGGQLSTLHSCLSTKWGVP